MPKGASLLPQDFAAGGALPDGDYTIKECRASTFDYQGKGPEGPSLKLLFVDDSGVELEQHYSAGKMEFLIPSEDGKRFVHPSGEEARLTKGSNCAAFIGSLITGGFPVAKLGDDVTAFEGTKVSIVNHVQPKRAGIKDQVEGKTIPLVSKVLALPGEAKRTAAKGAAGKPATPTPTTAATTVSSNGSFDEAAVGVVQEMLAAAPDNKLTRVKLGTNIMLTLSKDPMRKADMPTIKKLAQDAAWLQQHQEEGGWTIDGDTVSLG